MGSRTRPEAAAACTEQGSEAIAESRFVLKQGALGHTHLEERFVWWLWQTRRFDTAAARTAGYDIIFPGWFSTSAGPDFRDAIIADLQGNLRRGQVEIHVVDSAWRHHGHEIDPAYDGTILHVVLSRDSTLPTLTSSGSEVPILELSGLLTAPLDTLLASYDGTVPPSLPCPAQLTTPETALGVLVERGERRIEQKVRGLTADVEAIGADEALYRALAESLGFSANREPFRRIAEALPFALLSSLHVYEVEELLLEAAGLSGGRLLAAYLDGPVLAPGQLKTFRVRPSNHPARRLRALARLVDLHRLGLSHLFDDADPLTLWERFAVEGDVVLVGQSRARDIVINVCVPYLAAYRGEDAGRLLALLPAPGDNRWVAALRHKLQSAGVTIRPYRAVHQQGLLDLSLRFCRFDHCEACPLHGVSESD